MLIGKNVFLGFILELDEVAGLVITFNCPFFLTIDFVMEMGGPNNSSNIILCTFNVEYLSKRKAHFCAFLLVNSLFY